MFSDAILGCHGPEVRNVRIVTIRHHSNIGKLVREQVPGPEDIFITLVRPCVLPVSSETVYKDDATDVLACENMGRKEETMCLLCNGLGIVVAYFEAVGTFSARSFHFLSHGRGSLRC